MTALNISGFTQNLETPKAYLDQYLGYIPGTLDTIAERVTTPLITKIARISLICWFLFNLLDND